MNLVGDLLAVIFILGGLFFFAVGAIGIARLPDVYHRIHAMSKATTLGLMGLLIGAVLHIGTPNVLIMSLLTILFAFVATPVGSHMLAKAALRANAPQWEKTLSDEHGEDEGDQGSGTGDRETASSPAVDDGYTRPHPY